MKESQSGTQAGTERAGNETDCFMFWVEAQRLRELFSPVLDQPINLCQSPGQMYERCAQREKGSF